MKPTPGPWRAVTFGRNRVTFHAIVADSPTHPKSAEDIPFYGGHMVAESVIEANADLIAAAPLMLKALENLENDDGCMPASAWELVQQAVEAATGRRKA